MKLCSKCNEKIQIKQTLEDNFLYLHTRCSNECQYNNLKMLIFEDFRKQVKNKDEREKMLGMYKDWEDAK